MLPTVSFLFYILRKFNIFFISIYVPHPPSLHGYTVHRKRPGKGGGGWVGEVGGGGGRGRVVGGAPPPCRVFKLVSNIFLVKQSIRQSLFFCLIKTFRYF